MEDQNRLAMESGTAAPRRPLAPGGPQAGGRRVAADDEALSGPRRVRRIALVSALVALIPAAFSYLDTIAQPSNSSLGIRTVEWLRDHGARGLVAKVESIYYQLTAPAKGGPALRALPHVGYGGGGHGAGVRAKALAQAAGAPAAYRPARVAAMIHHGT